MAAELLFRPPWIDYCLPEQVFALALRPQRSTIVMRRADKMAAWASVPPAVGLRPANAFSTLGMQVGAR